MNLGIDTRRCRITMTEQVADLFQRRALFQKMRSASMAQTVRTVPAATDACLPYTAARNIPQCRSANRPVWWIQRQEQIAA
jgi:hypothetical protein